MKTILNNLKTNGFHIFNGAIPENEIQYLKAEISEVLNEYSEDSVKDRLFYRREESHNRQGDAFMISDSDTDLPSMNIKNTYIEKYFNLYCKIIEEAQGVPMAPIFKRTMMNVQTYYSDSLEVGDHYDGNFLEYHHEQDKEHDEFVLVIDKALLPRYVMVCVLENENDGKGVYIRDHHSNERIDVLLNPGDIIIFNNLAVRHGVPRLEKPRAMFGFRNFDYEPALFESQPEGGNSWIEFPDNKNPGWLMDISSDYSIEIQKEFNKIWKEKGYDENVRTSKPAF